MAEDVLLTLAIQPYEKAIILKSILEKEGIGVVVENVDSQQQPRISSGMRIRIKEKDLPKAMSLVEVSIPQGKLNRQGGILIPVDFSDYSVKACRIGFDYAFHHQTSVTLLHSYVNEHFSGTLPFEGKFRLDRKISGMFKDKEVAARRQMDEFVAGLKGVIPQDVLTAVNCRKEVVEGVPEESILEYAKQTGPALIVMATRGKHKKAQDLIGSVTAEVLDSVKYPLLAIPEYISMDDTDGIQNIVFYSNLEQADLVSLDKAVRSFRHSKVILAHVKGEHENLVDERMQALMAYCRYQYENVDFSVELFEEDSFLDRFEQCLIGNRIDLVVIPNKKRNIFTRLFSPSIAHRILFHTDIPMLVIPTK